MVLPNPFYIDLEARHGAAVLRALSYAACDGFEGVFAPGALKARALSSPGSSVMVDPGVYAVNCKHAGGDFENYVGKVLIAEQSPTISPVGSGGARTDLVFLRVENPFVAEATSWAEPPDPLNGPYASVRVVENVAPGIASVVAHNNTWSAIPICRITRPANKSIIEAGDIADLRSVKGAVRVIDPTTPPTVPVPPVGQPPVVTPPAGTPAPSPLIAFETFVRTVITSAADEHLSSQTSFHDFPSEAQWQIPVPTWANRVDITAWLTPQVQGNVWGELRFNLDGIAGSATVFDENPSGWVRPVMMVAGGVDIPEGTRGKTVKGKIQARSLDSGSHSGKLIASRGCTATVLLHFRRLAG
jgi:hypothetical protein